MIQCPNCNHQEMEGALFCSECGAQLVAQGSVTTHSIGRASGGLETPQPAPAIVSPAVSEAAEETMVSLYLVESGQVFDLVGKSEFTIGRATKGQP
ncbi:MAG: zinc ribbon domain-containing protein, partial [Anaerolineales bacterium]